MPIKINVSLVDGGVSKPVASTLLRETRITIGRDPKCTLPLADTRKSISRMHAEIEEKCGIYWMKVVSAVGPVLVNGRRHHLGDSVALATGDLLTLGMYRLEILVPAEDAADATLLHRGGAAIRAADRVREEDMANDLPYVHRPAAPQVMPKHPAAPALKNNPSTELTFIPRPDQDAIPKYQAVPALKKNLSAELTYIPPPERESVARHKVEHAHRVDEEPSAEITYVRPPAMRADALRGAAIERGADSGVKTALRAFFQGLGVEEMEVANPEAFLHDSGEMMRVAVEGIMLLLQTRALALEELGITEPAVGGTPGDNPLKEMSGPREAITYLFDPDKRAGARHDPVQAFGDACADLRAHEIALIESMRTIGLNALLSADPIAFDRAQEESLGMPGRNRKAKLWDLFVAHHNKLAHNTRNDFKTAFGQNMRSGYLVYFRRLRGGR